VIHRFFQKFVGPIVLAALVLALAGCGRRGPLEAPDATTPEIQSGGPQQDQTSNALAANNPAPASLDTSANQTLNVVSTPQGKPPAVTPMAPSFFLDPLVK
jgi:predicted small lipoprotein YifL